MMMEVGDSPQTRPIPTVEQPAPLHPLAPWRPYLRVLTPTIQVEPMQSLAGGRQWVCPQPRGLNPLPGFRVVVTTSHSSLGQYHV